MDPRDWVFFMRTAPDPERNAQFEHIAAQRQAFREAGWPIIRMDARKMELIGDFKSAGQAWSLEATAVNVHDFPQNALGRAVPYDIYDVLHNEGTVYFDPISINWAGKPLRHLGDLAGLHPWHGDHDGTQSKGLPP